jgi:crotonobetaine/carnitine-CoA ligase
MIEIDGRTIGEVWDEAAERYPENPLLVCPADERRSYHRQGYEVTYGEADAQIQQHVEALRQAGYGHGHRVVLDLENRPEHFLLKLALNAVGASCVPVNPDLRPAEVTYVFDDSTPSLAIVSSPRAAAFGEALAASGQSFPHVLLDDLPSRLPQANAAPPTAHALGTTAEASLLYTSGTTGRPKGCMLSHEYELMMGQWYANLGGLLSLEEGTERLYNPLPVFHLNALILSFCTMLLTGNCQIQPARFSRSAWWRDVHETRATIVHYLGIVVPALMDAPPGPHDTDHCVKFGVGAGVEPTLHGPFEERFGFPLVEAWGMTEMCRIFADNEEPRRIDTRAFGRPRPGLEARVVDENDNEVARGTHGELTIRHSGEAPRKGAFSGYLNQPEVTEESWRGGWFHTGDTVVQDDTGMLYFVDRKKNIIRRSGENISAAEIETCLLGHAAAGQVAVLAVDDEIRDEEVYACVVAGTGAVPGEALAERLFDHCFERLAYYKAPGWLLFLDDLPVTGTQKVSKHLIFGDDEDPTAIDGVFDFRERKRR